MNAIFILSFLALVIGAGYVAYTNFDPQTVSFKNPPTLQFTPPYSFNPGEWVGPLNAFFFVFLFSLLFFGLSTPLALGTEGAKFGSMLSTGGPPYDFVFIIPEILAAQSAVLLGQGVLRDFGSENTVFASWTAAAKYFAAGLALTLILVAARSLVIRG